MERRTRISRSAVGPLALLCLAPTSSNAKTTLISPGDDLQAAVDQLAAGDILVLADGVYSGAGLAFVDRQGSEGDPIAVRAQNDGRAVLRGGAGKAGGFLRFKDSAYIVVEGVFLTATSDPWYEASNQRPVRINTSHHITLRRVSAKDAVGDWSPIFGLVGSHHILLEDCAAYGNGKHSIVPDADCHDVTIRRFFSRWDGWAYGEQTGTQDWCTNTEVYGGYNVTVENFVGFLGPSPTQEVHHVLLAGKNQKLLGSIGLGGNAGALYFTGASDSLDVKNSFFSGAAKSSAFTVSSQAEGVLTHSYNAYWGIDPESAYKGTTAGANEGPTDPRWDTATYGLGAYLMASRTALAHKGEAGANIGADVLYRYVDGVLTQEPLWPWPMEQRIQEEAGVSVTWTLWKTLDGVYPELSGADGGSDAPTPDAGVAIPEDRGTVSSEDAPGGDEALASSDGCACGAGGSGPCASMTLLGLLLTAVLLWARRRAGARALRRALCCRSDATAAVPAVKGL